MNLFAISGLLISIPCFVLGIFTIFKARIAAHYIWAVFSFCVALWGFGGYMIAISLTENGAIFWWRFAYIGVILIPFLFTHFIHRFLNLPGKLLPFILYLVAVIFLFCDFCTNLFINNVRLAFDQFYYLSRPTALYNFFVVLFFFLIIYSHARLLLVYKKSQGITREQIKYISLATIVGFFGGAFAFLPVYNFDVYPILNITIFISPIVVAYAILKYRFMDLRVLARQIFIYVGLAAITYGLFYLIAWFYIKFFGGIFNLYGFLAGIVIAPAFVVALYKINNLLSSFANKYLFFSLYNYQETINKLSDELNYYIDLNKIINLIVDTIKRTMQLDRAGVLLVNQETTPIHYQIAKVIGFNKQNGISLVQDNFLTKYLLKIQRPLVLEELIVLARDTQNKKDRQSFERLHHYMKHIEASLCLPLLSSKKLIGIVVLGAKLSGDAYSQEDLNLLNTLSKQAGIALDNARLYQQVHNFNKTLQNKVDEQTKEIKQKNQYLQELLNMKDDFLRVVNHQLNTPISIVKGAFSLLKEGVWPKNKALFNIESGFERIAQTVADFWRAYELEGEKMAMEPSKVALEPIIENLITEKEKLKLAQERKLKIILKKPGFKLPLVWCDQAKITHVISNLLDNAVFYTEKGSVTVSFALSSDKNYLQISVKDTGVGLDAENKKRLFQKFSRGAGATSLHPDGSGLGLYIAKKIVEGNNGEMTYESAGPGQGTTFSFTLPTFQNQVKTARQKVNQPRAKIIIFEKNN